MASVENRVEDSSTLEEFENDFINLFSSPLDEDVDIDIEGGIVSISIDRTPDNGSSVLHLQLGQMLKKAASRKFIQFESGPLNGKNCYTIYANEKLAQRLNQAAKYKFKAKLTRMVRGVRGWITDRFA